ncbi:polysaccharide deacetylase, partial [Rhizobium johnstonii]
VEEDGIIRFGLPLIPEVPNYKPIIGMDYNLFVRHSKCAEDTADSAEFEDRAYAAFKEAFEAAIDDEPLQEIDQRYLERDAGVVHADG